MRAFSYASSLPITLQRWRSKLKPFDPPQPKHHAARKLDDSMFYRTGVTSSKFYFVGIGIVDVFGSCDLDLDPMTFIYELDPYPLEI